MAQTLIRIFDRRGESESMATDTTRQSAMHLWSAAR